MLSKLCARAIGVDKASLGIAVARTDYPGLEFHCLDAFKETEELLRLVGPDAPRLGIRQPVLSACGPVTKESTLRLRQIRPSHHDQPCCLLSRLRECHGIDLSA
jgi:hypothetical protein